LETAERLTARPHASRKSYVSGRTTLGLDSARDAISANTQIRTQLKLPTVGSFFVSADYADYADKSQPQ